MKTKIDWSKHETLRGIVAPPCGNLPILEYPDVLTEADLLHMEAHVASGWRLMSDFVRLIQEVRRLNGKQE